MGPKTKFFRGLSTILMMICIGWQYSVFQEDQRKLNAEFSILQNIYASLEDAHLLPEKIKRIDSAIEILSEKIPVGEYQNENLLKSIRTICLLNGTTYHLLEKKLKKQPLYKVDHIRFQISGMNNAVLNVLTEIDKMDRFINWTSLCNRRPMHETTRTEVTSSLTFYHLPTATLPKMPYLKKPDLEIQAWMPPFTYKLRKITEKTETAYDLIAATPNAEEQLQLVEEYKWKEARLLQMQSIWENLENRRSPLTSFLTDISVCLPN